MKVLYVIVLAITLITFYTIYNKKDHFKTVKQLNLEDYYNTYRPHVYTNQVQPAQQNDQIITKSFYPNCQKR